MDIEEKIKRLGLVPMTDQEFERIKQHYLDEIRMLPPPEKIFEMRKFDFVLWYKGKPVLYSRKYVEEHDIENIKAFVCTANLAMPEDINTEMLIMLKIVQRFLARNQPMYDSEESINGVIADSYDRMRARIRSTIEKAERVRQAEGLEPIELTEQQYQQGSV